MEFANKELIIITGVSGAGKSSAMGFLEDVGYYCIDNMPPVLLPTFIGLIANREEYRKVAIVVDVRSSEVFEDFIKSMNDAKSNYGYDVKIVYLDIKTPVALKRYKLTRRKHPYADRFNGDIAAALAYEKEILAPLRLRADHVIDTSDAAPNQLRTRLAQILLGSELLQKLIGLLDFLNPLYIREGKSQIVFAIGCTGGNHRSVAIAEALKDHFESRWDNVTVHHRDINRG